jgi:predicted nucleotidyltransferase
MKSIPQILQALNDDGVAFVLVGGFAVQLHGFIRSTLDLDLVLAMDDANLTKFIEVGKHFGLAPVIPVSIEALKNATQIEQWHREKGMLAFALREPGIAGSVIDVLVRPEIPFDRLAADANEMPLFGRQVKVASIDHLLEMKRAANRPKDRLDIEALEKIKRGEMPNA